MHPTSRRARVSPRSRRLLGTTAPNCGPVYRRRRPTLTPLYPLVQHHLETFLAQAAEADPMGDGVPSWVERDFRAYLRCGILAHGFARARCSGCGYDFLVAFSCKGRGVCPSCNARRMVETRRPSRRSRSAAASRASVGALRAEAHPALPAPQPHDRRRCAAHLSTSLRTTLRDASPGDGPDAHIGAISFLHRFGCQSGIT